MQYINVRLLWQHDILFSTLKHFFPSLNHLHRFKVSMYCSIYSVTLRWHKPLTAVCVLTEVVVAMSAKLVTFGSSSATFPFPG